MWKPIIRPSWLSEYEIDQHGNVRNRVTKKPHTIYKDTHGYLCIKEYVNGKQKEAKVHRLVADHFIRRIKKKEEVHHKDENPSNPDVTNLIICTKKKHRRLHATTESPVLCMPSKPGTTVLTEKQVHKICKMMEDGYSYPAIREKLELFNVTDDCLNKIKIGKNWTKISSQYNLVKKKRRCMNLYSDYALDIAILMDYGFKVKEIARVMNFECNDKTDYQRLFKAAKRYEKQYRNGEMGLITVSYYNSIIQKYINN